MYINGDSPRKTNPLLRHISEVVSHSGTSYATRSYTKRGFAKPLYVKRSPAKRSQHAPGDHEPLPLQRLQQKNHLYGFSPADLSHKLVAANGVYVVDENRRKLLDCASGTFDQPLGYQHPAITEAIRRQSETMQYAPSYFVADELLRLAEELVAMAPEGLNRAHLRDLTGSTAVEGAIKIAQVATGKNDVISLFAGHHGQTAYTTDISGNAFRRELYPAHMPGVIQVPSAYCFRCFYRQKPETCGALCAVRIADFVKYASSGNVACVIVEPIQGNGGNVMPPRSYFVKLREFCDENGILLIFDEVQTGLGRTGYMTAAEYYGVVPDIMVLGKGLSGAAPRAAILVKEELQKMPRGQHSHTGGSNLIGVAVALATLRELQKPGFLANVREVGDYLGDGLRSLMEEFPYIGDVRGTGLMWGMEIVNDDNSPNSALCNQLAESGPDFGLLLRTSQYGRGNVIKVRPPLILTHDQAGEILDKLQKLMRTA